MNELIKQLREALEKMTPGPWRASYRGSYQVAEGSVYAEHDELGDDPLVEDNNNVTIRGELRWDDASGIVALRNLVPQLLDALSESSTPARRQGNSPLHGRPLDDNGAIQFVDAPSGKQDSYDLSKDCDYGHYVTPSHDPLAATPFYHSPAANVTDSTPKQETVRDYRELYEQWKSKQLVYSDSWPEKLPWWTTRWTDFVTASLRADLNNSETIRHAEKEILIKEIEDHTKTRAELARVKQALQNLVTRLDEVHADERYKSVWTCYWIHGGRYTEPKYDKQLEQAQAALSGKEQGNG